MFYRRNIPKQVRQAMSAFKRTGNPESVQCLVGGTWTTMDCEPGWYSNCLYRANPNYSRR